MLLTDGIHIIDGVKGANSYLISGKHPFLVDTGFPGQEEKIYKYLEKSSIKLSELHGIILTHYDVDHIGSAFAIQQETGCPIYSHSLEIPFIINKNPRPGIKRCLSYIIMPVYGRLQVPEHVRPLEQQKPFEDWEIIHTPGHTPGHIILYRNGIAIVGDLLQGGRIRLAPSFFTWNSRDLKKSVENLIERPLRWILPGHGPATAASNHWLDHLQRSLYL